MDHSQNSIISYVPQPFLRSHPDFDFPTYGISAILDIDSIENGFGLFTPDLANYTLFNINDGAPSFTFSTQYIVDGTGLLEFYRTIALVGVALLTYEDDVSDPGNPDLATEFAEPVTCDLAILEGGGYWSFSHNSPNNIHTFNGVPMPGIISGGTANVVFSGVGPVEFAGRDQISTVFTFHRLPANVALRPYAKLIVGHLFHGVELPIIVDPRNFIWSMQVVNKRHKARDMGMLSSEGILVRTCSGQILKVANRNIIGQTVTEVVEDTPYLYVTAEPSTNFFDLVKINNSYPLLINPYPYTVRSADAVNPEFTNANEQFNLLARQNFFSIFGFLDDTLDITSSDFRDGLASEFRFQFRFTETR